MNKDLIVMAASNIVGHLLRIHEGHTKIALNKAPGDYDQADENHISRVAHLAMRIAVALDQELEITEFPTKEAAEKYLKDKLDELNKPLFNALTKLSEK